MAKHLWSVLCARTIIDKDSNSLSIIDVLEDITIIAYLDKEKKITDLSRVPTVGGAMGFQLMGYWMREDLETPEMAKARVELKSPTNKILVKQTFDIDLTKALRSRTKLDFLSVPLDGPDPKTNGPIPGTYTYKVQLQKGTKWITVTEQYLMVKVSEEITSSSST